MNPFDHESWSNPELYTSDIAANEVAQKKIIQIEFSSWYSKKNEGPAASTTWSFF